MSEAGEAIRFEGVTKRFGDLVAVDDMNLTIRQGEFFSLLGRYRRTGATSTRSSRAMRCSRTSTSSRTSPSG